MRVVLVLRFEAREVLKERVSRSDYWARCVDGAQAEERE
jgi:hypothetical protein